MSSTRLMIRLVFLVEKTDAKWSQSSRRLLW